MCEDAWIIVALALVVMMVDSIFDLDRKGTDD